MGNYINKLPDGTLLGPDKSDEIAKVATAYIKVLPDRVDEGGDRVLVIVVDNGLWEAALVADTQHDLDRVHRSKQRGDMRPIRAFYIDRDDVRKMADAPLESEVGV